MQTKNRLTLTVSMIITAFALLLGGCVAGSAPAPLSTPTPITVMPTDAPTPEPVSPAPISADDAANMTFTGIYTQPVQLVDGKFEGEPFVPGGASRPSVTLLADFFAQGDLNGDGLDDAGVLLIENSGGSGAFIYLAALLNGETGPINVSTVLVGDRGTAESLTIVDGAIVLALLAHSESDPMCCPSQPVTRTYALDAGVLTLLSEETAAAPAEDILSGTEWQLESIRQPDGTEQTPANPGDFTLTFEDGQMGGQADCNNVSAGYEVTESGGLVLGPMITTLAMCAPESLYDAYTLALGQVTGFMVEEGKLVLTFGEDGSGLLIFEAPGVVKASEASTLAGTAWQLQLIRQPDGTEQIPTDPAAYQLTFDESTQIRVQADCNRGFADFTTAQPNQLTFGVMGLTRALCQPGSLADAYVAALEQVSAYTFEEGKLILTFGDSGTLVFISN